MATTYANYENFGTYANEIVNNSTNAYRRVKDAYKAVEELNTATGWKGVNYDHLVTSFNSLVEKFNTTFKNIQEDIPASIRQIASLYASFDTSSVSKVADDYDKISELEKTDTVKRYLELKESLIEKTTGCNTGFDRFTDAKLVSIALSNVDITPDVEVYVYIGTYKYDDEFDIVHGSNDISVSRTCPDADYVIYKSLESKYNDTIQVPYKKADEFEASHKIIIPHNVLSRERYFYDLKNEYFETMILESQEKALEKIKKYQITLATRKI